MAEFGHFTPIDVVPDPFLVDGQTWDDDITDPFDEPALVFWEDSTEPDPFLASAFDWADDLVLPDPFDEMIPEAWEVFP